MNVCIPDIPATTHSLKQSDARALGFLNDQTLDLVVTSPPYPMIAMWDHTYRDMNNDIGRALDEGDGRSAFALMHQELEKTWSELLRVVRPGGFICINIGDAVRTVDGTFRLYPNHIEIERFFMEHGVDVLPRIIWRKTTNAPTKFMGSGVLPAGAYVTLEHEYILIFRQSGKRNFNSTADKARRQRSALFWEERNSWYADLWDLGGARQKMNRKTFDESSAAGAASSRQRSAAFPFALAYRLICMYSLQGDVILDPFLGTGTTIYAAAALGRNSMGTDIDPSFITLVQREFSSRIPFLAQYNQERLVRHRHFTKTHAASGNTFSHVNEFYGFPVKTRQEKKMVMPIPGAVTEQENGIYRIEYSPAGV